MKTITALFILAFALTGCSSNQEKSQNQTSNSTNQVNSNSQSQTTDVKPKNFVIADTKNPVIKPSDLVEKLRKKLEDTSGMTAKQVADYGNELLKTEGYDYTFSWEPKGVENKENLKKIGTDFYPFTYEFTDTKGNRRVFQLMNDDFSHPCFSVIDIPITKVNEQTMTIVSGGKEFELKRPQDFYLEEFELLGKDLKKTVRKWKTPIDAVPIGISEDGTKIYFESWEFYQEETDSDKNAVKLAVEVSEDGSLRLIDSNEIKSDIGVVFDYDKQNTEIQYKKFKVGNTEYNVRYSAPCT